MSSIINKGDFLVFEDTYENRATEFFISSTNVDWDDCYIGSTGRRFVNNCFGFSLRDNHLYRQSSYWITRKATLEERDRFLRWMEEKGHKFNMNTLELTLNR